MFKRKRVFKKRHCPHVHLQGLYGDVINAVGGWRLQCVDCWTFLDGPVSLANVDRDPEGVVPHQQEWFFGKYVGEKFW